VYSGDFPNTRYRLGSIDMPMPNILKTFKTDHSVPREVIFLPAGLRGTNSPVRLRASSFGITVIQDFEHRATLALL
jgi:hypothetical protein